MQVAIYHAPFGHRMHVKQKQSTNRKYGRIQRIHKRNTAFHGMHFYLSRGTKGNQAKVEPYRLTTENTTRRSG